MNDEPDVRPMNIIHSETPITGIGTLEIVELTTQVTRLGGQTKRLHDRLDEMEIKLLTAQHENTQVLRTVMVGWNAFLKSAEDQLRGLFKGAIPTPILRKLILTAFKGLDEPGRKGQ